ncbi:MAG TPA: hypothetical protein VLC46_16030 [Thermoanaerobaculia bacterium]|jgi:hypothetical protein|nr:hypothetical protein [Thermoanaerobaculia bacterium]
MTADTVIEFIGLCVFTTQIMNPSAATLVTNRSMPAVTSEAVAIMPSVPQSMIAPNQASLATAARAASGSQNLSPEPSVEAHTAMIIFKSCDLLSISGWAINKLDDKGWVYIKLAGDHVHFVADAANPTVTPTNNLQIAHIGPNALTSPYSPPSYSGAAAVFTISTGTLSACAKDTSAAPRLDTRLTLHTVNTVTVMNDTGNKSVTLRAAAQIFAANVPLGFAQTGTASINAHDHYLVYCSMIGKALCAMPTPNQEPTTLCDSPLMRPNQAGSSPPPSVLAVDSGCSNTQWP